MCAIVPAASSGFVQPGNTSLQFCLVSEQVLHTVSNSKNTQKKTLSNLPTVAHLWLMCLVGNASVGEDIGGMRGMDEKPCKLNRSRWFNADTWSQVWWATGRCMYQGNTKLKKWIIGFYNTPLTVHVYKLGIWSGYKQAGTRKHLNTEVKETFLETSHNKRWLAMLWKHTRHTQQKWNTQINAFSCCNKGEIMLYKNEMAYILLTAGLAFSQFRMILIIYSLKIWSTFWCL